MVHGSLRIGAVYMAGVLAGFIYYINYLLILTLFKSRVLIKSLSLLGSLGTSVFDTDVYLVGASGGVYALLAAHLANVLLVSSKFNRCTEKNRSHI